MDFVSVFVFLRQGLTIQCLLCRPDCPQANRDPPAPASLARIKGCPCVAGSTLGFQPPILDILVKLRSPGMGIVITNHPHTLLTIVRLSFIYVDSILGAKNGSEQLGVSATLLKDLSLDPSTHIRWLRRAYGSTPRGSDIPTPSPHNSNTSGF